MRVTNDDIENLLDHQYGKADILTVLMLLYPSLDYNNKFHIDHIYPKSKFTKSALTRKGVPADKIDAYISRVNELSNLQLLAAIPNIEKQNEDFADWFADTYPADTDKIQYQTINYMPDMEYTYGNFETFINKRRALIKTALGKVLL